MRCCFIFRRRRDKRFFTKSEGALTFEFDSILPIQSSMNLSQLCRSAQSANSHFGFPPIPARLSPLSSLEAGPLSKRAFASTAGQVGPAVDGLDRRALTPSRRATRLCTREAVRNSSDRFQRCWAQRRRRKGTTRPYCGSMCHRIARPHLISGRRHTLHLPKAQHTVGFQGEF